MSCSGRHTYLTKAITGNATDTLAIPASLFEVRASDVLAVA